MKALLVIDMQKEGIEDSYGTGIVLYNKDLIVNNIKKLIKNFKENNHLVIEIKVWITDPEKTSMTKVYPGEGIANTTGTEIIDELKDEKFDYNVKKDNYSGFWNTELDQILKKHDIKEVYLTGINTGFCVFLTGIDAFYRGFDTFLVQDATSTVAGVEHHEKGTERFKWFCGEKNVVDTKDLLNE